MKSLNSIDTFHNDVTIETYRKLYHAILVELLKDTYIPIYHTNNQLINSINTDRMSQYIDDEIAIMDNKIITYDQDIYNIHSDNINVVHTAMSKYYTITINSYPNIDDNVEVKSIIEYNFTAHSIAHRICFNLNCIYNMYNIYNKLFDVIKICVEPHVNILASQIQTFTFSPKLILNCITHYIATLRKSVQNEMYKYYSNDELSIIINDSIKELLNFTMMKVNRYLCTIATNTVSYGKIITNERNATICQRVKYIRLQRVIREYGKVKYINDKLNKALNGAISHKLLLRCGDLLITLYAKLHKILTTDGPTVIKFDLSLDNIDQVVESAIRVNMHDLDFTIISNAYYKSLFTLRDINISDITHTLTDKGIVCVYKNSYELYNDTMTVIDNIRNDWKDAFILNIYRFL